MKRVSSYKFDIGGFSFFRSRLSSSLFVGTSLRVLRGTDWRSHDWRDEQTEFEKRILEGCYDFEFCDNRVVGEFEEVVDIDYSNLLECKRRKEYNKDHKLNRRNVFAKAMAYAGLEKSKKFLAFYSISFPAGTTDEQAVRVFNVCRTRLKRDFGFDSWLRVCERQKNGTIHFHLLTNVYVPVLVFNRVFAVSIRNLLGYTGNYNGVDVEGITKSIKRRKNKNCAASRSRLVASYLVKYLSKDDTTVFRVSPYSCSRDVSRLSTSISVGDSSFVADFVSSVQNYADRVGFKFKTFCSDFAVRHDWPKKVDESTGEILHTSFWDGSIYQKILYEFNNIASKCKDSLTVLSLLLEKMCLNTVMFRKLIGSPIISCDGWVFR